MRQESDAKRALGLPWVTWDRETCLLNNPRVGA